MLINRKKNSRNSTNQLLYNKRIYTDKRNICEHLNSHFINVSPTLEARINDYIVTLIPVNITQDHLVIVSCFVLSMPKKLGFSCLEKL